MPRVSQVPRLAIVVPCYNEEQVLPVMAPEFVKKLQQLAADGLCTSDSRVVFVDDGSKDSTWSIIAHDAQTIEEVEGIKLSRNRGHQHALLCGLMEAKDHFDATISIDCDGQDSLDAMDDMLRAYANGCEVVYGVRDNRDTDTWFKRTTAEGFYKLLEGMGVECVFNHADYRLLSRRVLDELGGYHEVNLFLRGMVPLVGFKSATVTYARAERIAGESHYPLKKMLQLAIDGITSLSIRPIRLVTSIGALMLLLSLVLFIVLLATGSLAGTKAIICMLLLVGGIQTTGLGIVGEYVGKSYMEVKRRPRWIVEQSTLDA